MISFSDRGHTTVIIKGPTKVSVEGRVSIFGCEIKQISLPEGKILPFYFEEDSTLFFDDGTFFIPVKGNTIPDSWKKASNRSEKSFFIYGPSDSGKSSLATFLNNTIPGRKVIVDLDIGQSSLAHPGAMGIAVSQQKLVSISELRMVDGEFVGTISPGGMETRCLNAVFDIKRKIDGLGEKVIIDSTGWVKGRKANEYKLAKLNILQPELILAFERPSFADFMDFEFFEVEQFAAARRSRSTRINFRSRKYAEFLSEAREIELELKKLKSRGWKILSGKPLEGDELSILSEVFEKLIYAEKGEDFLNVFVEERTEVSKEVFKALKEVFAVEDLHVLPENELIGLVVGLYSNRYLGFGIIRDVDYGGRLKVLTSVKDEVSRIEFGEFRLDENFKECFVRFS
jgi:polynucleotide 5'-hydroxyl-kinase GRC3/NOL9